MKRIFFTLSTIFILCGFVACNSTSKANKETSQETQSNSPKNKVALVDENSKNTVSNETQSTGIEIECTVLHYQISTLEDGELQPQGDIKIYFANDQLRVESDLNLFSDASVVLTDNDKSGMGFLFFPEEETYVKRNLKSSAKNHYMRLYESNFKLTSEEELDGIEGITMFITSEFDYLKFAPEMDNDDIPLKEKEGVVLTKYWLTDELPNTAGISKILKDKPQLLDGLYDRVYQNDLIPFKIEERRSGDVSRVIELIAYEETRIGEDQFEVPDGYSLKN